MYRKTAARLAFLVERLGLVALGDFPQCCVISITQASDYRYGYPNSPSGKSLVNREQEGNPGKGLVEQGPLRHFVIPHQFAGIARHEHHFEARP